MFRILFDLQYTPNIILDFDYKAKKFQLLRVLLFSAISTSSVATGSFWDWFN